jgi:hypothetical protein
MNTKDYTMRYLVIILALFACGCQDRIVDNPGDPTLLIVIDDIQQVVPPPLPGKVGCCTLDGSAIYVQRQYHPEPFGNGQINPGVPYFNYAADNDCASMDRVFKHEFCHLVDLVGDVTAARKRMPNLSYSWRRQVDWLIEKRLGSESLWLTLQREYPGLDIIQHQEIKDKLGVKP